MNRPDSRTSAKACFRRATSGAYCARTSTRGIGGTSSESRGAPPQHEEDSDDDDRGDDGVVDVVPALVEALPVGADRPADGGEAEAPGRGAGGREDGVAAQPHPPDPGGDGDERPDDGRHATEQDE